MPPGEEKHQELLVSVSSDSPASTRRFSRCWCISNRPSFPYSYTSHYAVPYPVRCGTESHVVGPGMKSKPKCHESRLARAVFVPPHSLLHVRPLHVIECDVSHYEYYFFAYFDLVWAWRDLMRCFLSVCVRVCTNEPVCPPLYSMKTVSVVAIVVAILFVGSQAVSYPAISGYYEGTALNIWDFGASTAATRTPQNVWRPTVIVPGTASTGGTDTFLGEMYVLLCGTVNCPDVVRTRLFQPISSSPLSFCFQSHNTYACKVKISVPIRPLPPKHRCWRRQNECTPISLSLTLLLLSLF